MEKVEKGDDGKGKYSGIYINKLMNGTISYYISFRDENNKVRKEKIGTSPEMNKTKALEKLNDKKKEIREIKKALKNGETISLNSKKKNDRKIYTLNDLTDFYLENNNEIRTKKDIQIKYNYHIRNEAFANKPVQLVTRDDLVDFVDRKKNQRADKRRYKQEDKSIEDKEKSEFENNMQKIEKLQEKIKRNKMRGEEIWREENFLEFLKKKNDILKIRQDEKLRNKVLNDPVMTIDEKRYVLGLLSHKTIKELLLLCSTIVNHAIFEKKLNIKNPFTVSKKDKKLYIEVDNERDRFLTEDELKFFLKEVKNVSHTQIKHKNIYLMVLLGLSLAARQSSILSIKLGDIDLANMHIHLRNFKIGRSYNGFIASEEIHNGIVKLIDGRDDQDAYLFTNYTGKRVSRYPRKILEILNYTVNYRRSYFKWLSLKDLRNTAASHLAMSGIPLQHIAKLLNHSDIATTQRYAHLSKDSGDKAVEDFMASLKI